MVPPVAGERQHWEGQCDRRKAEHAVRIHSVAMVRWLKERGLSEKEIARNLGISRWTLRYRMKRWGQGWLNAAPRGRPLKRGPLARRKEVAEALNHAGPLTGVPALRDGFPDMPRAELCDQLLCYRRAYVKEKGYVNAHELEWAGAMVVWTLDFANAPSLIDGMYPYLAAMRDVGADYQLVWQPSKTKKGWAAASILEAQIQRYGAPLVLKVDNGLDTWEVRKVCKRYGITLLVNPGGTPEYNGSIEAGIGAMKTIMEWLAVRAGRPGIWTADDAEGALLFRNRNVHPGGELFPSAEVAWEKRVPITPEARTAFRAYVKERREDLPKETFYYEPFVVIGPPDIKIAERRAIVQALVKLGYLKIRTVRRRIRLKIKGARSARAKAWS